MSHIDAAGYVDEKIIKPRARKPNGGTGNPVNPFALVALDDIQVDDDPVWLIEGLLPAGPAFHLVWGKPKSFKSFGLMHAYLHIAAGREYAGRAVLPGAVAYVTNEGVRGVARRLVAMRRHMEVEGLGVPFYLVRVMPNLGSGTDDAARLIAAINAVVPAGVTLRALAVDTVRRATPGKDENSAKDMSPFIENCGIIAKEFQCLVSGVHHSPRSSDEHGAGTNALDGAMDCGWSVERSGEQATITVSVMKDGEQGDSWDFSLAPWQVGTTRDGEPIMGCSVTIDRLPGADVAPKATAKGGMTKAGAIALRALREAVDEVGAVPPASNHIPEKIKTVTVEQWRDYAYRRGISSSSEPRAKQQAFQRSHTALIGSGHANVWDGQAWPT
jgi:hypothetical protein